MMFTELALIVIIAFGAVGILVAICAIMEPNAILPAELRKDLDDYYDEHGSTGPLFDQKANRYAKAMGSNYNGRYYYLRHARPQIPERDQASEALELGGLAALNAYYKSK